MYLPVFQLDLLINSASCLWCYLVSRSISSVSGISIPNSSKRLAKEVNYHVMCATAEFHRYALYVQLSVAAEGGI